MGLWGAGWASLPSTGQGRGPRHRYSGLHGSPGPCRASRGALGTGGRVPHISLSTSLPLYRRAQESGLHSGETEAHRPGPKVRLCTWPFPWPSKTCGVLVTPATCHGAQPPSSGAAPAPAEELPKGGSTDLWAPSIQRAGLWPHPDVVAGSSPGQLSRGVSCGRPEHSSTCNLPGTFSSWSPHPGPSSDLPPGQPCSPHGPERSDQWGPSLQDPSARTPHSRVPLQMEVLGST